MADKFSLLWGDLSEKVELSTITKCSEDDDKKEYLVKSEKVVINFDEVSKILAKELQVAKPSSVDTLYVQDGLLYLIEFKNTTKPKPDEVRVKVHDTLAILALSGYITDADHHFIKMILVRKFKGTARKEGRRLENAGLQPQLRKGLDFLQKVYPFVEFFDMSPDDYKELINKQNNNEVSPCTQ